MFVQIVEHNIYEVYPLQSSDRVFIQLPIGVKLSCPLCGSLDSIKNGKRYNKHTIKQRYGCRDCGKTWTIGCVSSFPQVVREKAITLYKTGLSLRQVCKNLKHEYQRGPSSVTVLRWLEKAKTPRRFPKNIAISTRRKNQDKIEVVVLTLIRHIQKRRTITIENPLECQDFVAQETPSK